jgi:hypothetical protein
VLARCWFESSEVGRVGVTRSEIPKDASHEAPFG